jgi:oxalate decarboxylase/phosphoglucose isomerase-like protein (cupin superfamily)
VDSTNFHAASTIAAALVELDPGAMRELHWRPTNDEWQYYISGQAKMTVFASSGKARTFDYQAGDVGYVPFAMGHYILNTGTEPVRFLEMFRSDHFADISLNQWDHVNIRSRPSYSRAHSGGLGGGWRLLYPRRSRAHRVYYFLGDMPTVRVGSSFIRPVQ